jgi:hypothetical protein
MTCGFSRPLAPVRDGPCPCATVLTRTQRGPRSGQIAPLALQASLPPAAADGDDEARHVEESGPDRHDQPAHRP